MITTLLKQTVNLFLRNLPGPSNYAFGTDAPKGRQGMVNAMKELIKL